MTTTTDAPHRVNNHRTGQLHDVDTGGVNGTSGIFPHHLAELRKSGLSDETIRAAGIRSEANHGALAALLERKRWSRALGAALVFPFVNEAGAVAFHRVKPDNAPSHRGKPAKYLSPTGAGVRLYVPPNLYPVLDDPKIELLITEGEKKALCGTQEGFPTVGLTGVDCWHVKRSSALLPDLARINWRGREVFIAFDSDAVENENVKTNERPLSCQDQCLQGGWNGV